MVKENQNNADSLQLLSLFESGVLTVQVNGYPVLKVDAEKRSLDLEAQGIKECGIKLSNLMALEGGGKGVREIISASETTARRLFDVGWSLILYDKGSRILQMGRGVSRLTGHIQVNLFKFRKILKSL